MRGDTAGLSNLFLENLQVMYYTEKHMVDALGKMQAKCINYNLKDTLTHYRDIAKGHIRRMEEVFHLIGEQPAGRKCEMIRDVIKEADDVIRKNPDACHGRDTGLMTAVQKAGHYGIVVYGMLVALAKKTGFVKEAGLLQLTLQEEYEADIMLVNVAKELNRDNALQYANV